MATPFENFVNSELPKRIYTNDAVGGVTSGKRFITTGVGLGVTLDTAILLSYQGLFDASGPSMPLSPAAGHTYFVTVEGTAGTVTTYSVGDVIFYDGSAWRKMGSGSGGGGDPVQVVEYATIQSSTLLGNASITTPYEYPFKTFLGTPPINGTTDIAGVRVEGDLVSAKRYAFELRGDTRGRVDLIDTATTASVTGANLNYYHGSTNYLAIMIPGGANMSVSGSVASTTVSYLSPGFVTLPAAKSILDESDTITVVVDRVAHKLQFYVNGVFLGEVSFPSSSVTYRLALRVEESEFVKINFGELGFVIDLPQSVQPILKLGSYTQQITNPMKYRCELALSESDNTVLALAERGDLFIVTAAGLLNGASFLTGDVILYLGADQGFVRIANTEGGASATEFPWVFYSSPYLMAFVNTNYVLNTFATDIMVTLPITHDEFDRIVLIPARDTYSAHPVTIHASGSDKISGQSDDVLVNVDGATLELIWSGDEDTGWIVINRGDTLIKEVINASGVGYFVDINDDGGVGHSHSSYITQAEALSLIAGDVANVVKLSSTAAAHSHTLTYTYSAGKFAVAIADNHAGEEHVGVIVGGEGSGTLEWEDLTATLITADTLASRGYFIDSSAGSVSTPAQVNLPDTPTHGDTVRYSDALGQFATNPLQINRNGELIHGIADNFVADQDNMTVEFTYSGATRGWLITSIS